MLGDVEHIVVYVGPGGRCVEAGAKGMVIALDMIGSTWDSRKITEQGGVFIDRDYGVAYPLEGTGFDETQSTSIREEVAQYCLDQLGKPYNVNFLDSSTERAFYCKPYLKQGIGLNTRIGIPDIPGSETIIFPEEVWSGSVHRPDKWQDSKMDAREEVSEGLP